MSQYVTNLFANSPLLTYSPPVGQNLSTGWMNIPFVDVEPQYVTSLPKASVSFDFYGDQFELSGMLTAFAAGDAPPCDFNVSINGVLQNETSYYHPYNDLPLGEHHVEVTFFCPQEGQEVAFTGPAFVETQGKILKQSNPYLNISQISTLGEWTVTPTFQYTTTSLLSTLVYSFKGVHTQIFGAVGPTSGPYLVTLDAIPQPLRTAYNPVAGPTTVLWFAQELEEKEHTVTITNFGKNLTVQAIQYTDLL
ncbi:hypothetical protein DACRYDRAFT_16125 [Dacryopinax primogenitus]|uniref:Uncharacterized protein n=1 Tax=Dacryopinax primogenitus (strain DJM 731) TaxID=1858805 RepID=M5FZV0_DACPD|nr:uncharacterized protein DACRYDRAFT_16125 [Dacryopinax primogenitus]EJU01420.1 hypothetical protein DACRYDRAFT_16125 [Dacryopinax primogenitus]